MSQFHVVFTTDKLVSAGSKRLLTKHTFLGHVSPGKDVGVNLRECGVLHLELLPVHRLPPCPLGRKGRPQVQTGQPDALGRADTKTPTRRAFSSPGAMSATALPAGECVQWTRVYQRLSHTQMRTDRRAAERDRFWEMRPIGRKTFAKRSGEKGKKKISENR